MTRRSIKLLPALLTAVSIVTAQNAPPIAPDDEFKGVIGTTDKESQPYFPAPVKPKPGSPNVVYIVLDDVGWSDLGSYGSEIHTPNLDKLAFNGLRYRNFHTRAICSPTRAALLTGRNSHAVGMRTVANYVNGFPNGRGRVTKSAATLAEILQAAGYNTFAVGKWHLVPPNDSSPAGPFDHWPVERGFDHYYGFLDGMTDQYHPELVQDNTYIDPPDRPGYHLSVDLVDHAIHYIGSQVAEKPDTPFFLYLALGAAHAPHQVPKQYIDKYESVFAKGWDQTRLDRLARQKQLGLLPTNAELSPRNPGIKPWDTLTADEKRFYLRLQSAFAGFLEHADEQVGRLTSFLAGIDKLDNTVFVVISDNGASQEGGLEGTMNELSSLSRLPENLAANLERVDDIGTDSSFTNYPLGWAMAGNTPFPYYKQTVHGGGTNDPLIIHWPKGIAGKGQVRKQFVDVIDITPTILDITGISAPTVYKGVPQMPLQGASILATIHNPDAPDPRSTQYFEQGGNRAIWHEGWKAVALHKSGEDFDRDNWELYNLNQDFSESNNLADREPERLKALKDLWWSEARKYNVLPLDGRDLMKTILVSQTNLRHDLLNSRKHYTFYQGQSHIPAIVAPSVLNRSYAITAYIDRPASGEGVLLALGDLNGGYSFFIKDNKLVYDLNSFGKHSTITASESVPEGKSVVRYEFALSAPFEGTGSLSIDGRKVAEQKLHLPRSGFSAWGGMDVGRDQPSSVTPVYADRGSFAFPTGGIQKIDFDILEPKEQASGAGTR